MKSPLPTWAHVVQTLTAPMTTAQCIAAGLTKGSLLDAEQGGHITCAGKGANVLYSTTFKGRRSFSVVKADQVIMHSKAVPTVVPGRTAFSPPPYVPETPPPMRPGAQDFLNIKSKGF